MATTRRKCCCKTPGPRGGCLVCSGLSLVGVELDFEGIEVCGDIDQRELNILRMGCSPLGAGCFIFPIQVYADGPMTSGDEPLVLTQGPLGGCSFVGGKCFDEYEAHAFYHQYPPQCDEDWELWHTVHASVELIDDYTEDHDGHIRVRVGMGHLANLFSAEYEFDWKNWCEGMQIEIPNGITACCPPEPPGTLTTRIDCPAGHAGVVRIRPLFALPPDSSSSSSEPCDYWTYIPCPPSSSDDSSSSSSSSDDSSSSSSSSSSEDSSSSSSSSSSEDSSSSSSSSSSEDSSSSSSSSSSEDSSSSSSEDSSSSSGDGGEHLCGKCCFGDGTTVTVSHERYRLWYSSGAGCVGEKNLYDTGTSQKWSGSFTKSGSCVWTGQVLVYHATGLDANGNPTWGLYYPGQPPVTKNVGYTPTNRWQVDGVEIVPPELANCTTSVVDSVVCQPYVVNGMTVAHIATITKTTVTVHNNTMCRGEGIECYLGVQADDGSCFVLP